ncbi:MAG: hypothetical protein MZW92_07305 [Comamonadaceae bacterium]|nr:hypothetical protein [Comamonadaceae bacterium]
MALESLHAQDESVLNRLLEARAPGDVEARATRRPRRAVDGPMQALVQAVPAIDPTLEGAARSVAGKISHELQGLHAKIIHAAKRRDDTLRRQFTPDAVPGVPRRARAGAHRRLRVVPQPVRPGAGRPPRPRSRRSTRRALGRHGVAPTGPPCQPTPPTPPPPPPPRRRSAGAASGWRSRVVVGLPLARRARRSTSLLLRHVRAHHRRAAAGRARCARCRACSRRPFEIRRGQWLVDAAAGRPAERPRLRRARRARPARRVLAPRRRGHARRARRRSDGPALRVQVALQPRWAAGAGSAPDGKAVPTQAVVADRASTAAGRSTASHSTGRC